VAPTVFVDAAEVAAMIGCRSTAEFRRERARLERDHDLPLPMPTSTTRPRWRREEIEGWVRSQGRAASAMQAASPVPASASALLQRARVA
jgi:predicted DNA-binding transcriptional regulator AlpA